MKRILLAAVALVFSVSMFAQQPQHGQRREFNPETIATRMADNMKKALDLTDEQYKSVYDLYLKQFQEARGSREKAPQGQQANQQARREAMKKQQETMNAELKKILTQEQYAKYEEEVKKMQQRQRQGQGGPRGGQRGQGMGPR